MIGLNPWDEATAPSHGEKVASNAPLQMGATPNLAGQVTVLTGSATAAGGISPPEPSKGSILLGMAITCGVALLLTILGIGGMLAEDSDGWDDTWHEERLPASALENGTHIEYQIEGPFVPQSFHLSANSQAYYYGFETGWMEGTESLIYYYGPLHRGHVDVDARTMTLTWDEPLPAGAQINWSLESNDWRYELNDSGGAVADGENLSYTFQLSNASIEVCNFEVMLMAGG